MTSYLPIGSLVALKQDLGCWIIAGYLPHTQEDSVYDYFAVPFPLGMLGAQDYLCFDRNAISHIIHTGFCDESCQNVLDGLAQFSGNLDTLAQKLKEGHNHE